MAVAPSYKNSTPVTQSSTGSNKTVGVLPTKAFALVNDQYLPDFEVFRYTWVGVGGDIVFEFLTGDIITYPNVPGGQKIFHPPALRVRGGTSANGLVGEGGSGIERP